MKRFIKLISVLCSVVFLLSSCSSDKKAENADAEVSSTKSSTTITSTTTSEERETSTSTTSETTTSSKATTSSTKKSTTKTDKPSDNSTPTKENSVSYSKNGKKIETKNGITYVDGILIANKTYALPSTYAPGVTSAAQAAVNKMIAGAKGDGITLTIVSGYRSYSKQNRIYNNYVSQDGKAAADRYSARPGHSEHQTGLAFDMNSLSQSFENTAEGKWLAANCYKYGFIIRYPKGKEGTTGYMYEPWHVRYLGTDTATKVYNSGLCLEDYLGITSVY